MYTIIERPDNNVRYIRIRNPKYKKNGKLKTDPVFLCAWNSHEKVEIHTASTLNEVYGDTIGKDSIFVNTLTKSRLTINEILDPESDILGVEYFCDNMSITKIK